MSGAKSDWIYDELLCFLGSALFQAPVTGFMEEYCLIFDPSVEDSEEYKKISHAYKRLVQKLLDAFCKDTKLSHDDVIKALNDMNAKKDIREVFQGLFEQVLAMDDYEVFVRLMTQKNIELQQQALMLILKTTGALPDSLTEGASEPPKPSSQQNEDDIMQKVLEMSKREYEEDQKRREKDKVEIDKIVAVSKLEVNQLEEQKRVEQEKLNQAVANVSLKDMPPIVPVPVTASKLSTESSQSKPKAPPAMVPVQQKAQVPATSFNLNQSKMSGNRITNFYSQPVVKAGSKSIVASGGGDDKPIPSVSQTKLGPGLLPQARVPGLSGSEAAANWMKSAQNEAGSDSHASAVQKAAAAMAGMNADEIKKRQDYLRQQRDKLVAMKKKEREKQLLTAEQSNPGRPMSAQAARQSMKHNVEEDSGKKELSAEEKKKIEMRKAIADRLKAEVIGK